METKNKIDVSLSARCPFCLRYISRNYIKENRYEIITEEEAIDCPDCGSQLIIANSKRIPKKPTKYIRPKIHLKDYQLDELREDIQYQKDHSDFVVIPSWCEVIYERYARITPSIMETSKDSKLFYGGNSK